MTHRILQRQIDAFDCDLKLSPKCEETSCGDPDEMENWMVISVSFSRRFGRDDGRRDCCPHCYAELCTATPALFIQVSEDSTPWAPAV